MRYSLEAVSLVYTLKNNGTKIVKSGMKQLSDLKSDAFELFFTDISKSEQEISAFNHYKNLKKTLKERKNFASSNLGASILRNSKGVKSSKAILTSSNEQYMHIENCNNKGKESVVIILSDFVQVDTIMVSNREDFSAELFEVTFYGSVESPTNDAWFKIGSISPEQSQLEGHHGIHILEIKEQE